VVGPASVVQHMQGGLDHAAPGGFGVVPTTSVSAARNRILGQNAGGALVVPPSGPTTILTAGAAGLTVQQVVTSALWASSRALGRPAIVHDIAPLPASDRSGLASFDFELALLIPSVLVSLMLYFIGRNRRIWNRTAAAGVFILLVSAAGVLAQYAIVGSLTAAPAAAYGIGVLGAASFVVFVVACQAVVGLAVRDRRCRPAARHRAPPHLRSATAGVCDVRGRAHSCAAPASGVGPDDWRGGGGIVIADTSSERPPPEQATGGFMRAAR
jgi:hypothetical protein